MSYYPFHHRPDPGPEWAQALDRKLTLILEGMTHMATAAQLAALQADVAALITAAVAEINVAVAAAQAASPDPAIDALDASVKTTTQQLTDAAARLANPPA